ncbi:hypothetical protein FRACA_190031 [Frankia canadensis]|uniref:Uncharacterized protein n=1 Tax=Frankia canadensis TaxID=1836972 RepID=A0A2I2KP84_9ACTN|nr:hypothetical protein FRACA_190031 [Frankia canadensis]SOU54742.1 hypothetical protein FRACA_190031 [Frankia canadensis]
MVESSTASFPAGITVESVDLAG